MVLSAAKARKAIEIQEWVAARIRMGDWLNVEEYAGVLLGQFVPVANAAYSLLRWCRACGRRFAVLDERRQWCGDCARKTQKERAREGERKRLSPLYRKKAIPMIGVGEIGGNPEDAAAAYEEICAGLAFARDHGWTPET